MQWFVARIVFRIISGDGDHGPQFDEQLKLISARDEKAAFEKAHLIGRSGEDCFPNSLGENVVWKFIGIVELTKINGLEDGTELSSKIVEADHAGNYLDFIRQKNQDIESSLVSLKLRTIAP